MIYSRRYIETSKSNYDLRMSCTASYLCILPLHIQQTRNVNSKTSSTQFFSLFSSLCLVRYNVALAVLYWFYKYNSNIENSIHREDVELFRMLCFIRFTIYIKNSHEQIIPCRRGLRRVVMVFLAFFCLLVSYYVFFSLCNLCFVLCFSMLNFTFFSFVFFLLFGYFDLCSSFLNVHTCDNMRVRCSTYVRLQYIGTLMCTLIRRLTLVVTER